VAAIVNFHASSGSSGTRCGGSKAHKLYTMTLSYDFVVVKIFSQMDRSIMKKAPTLRRPSSSDFRENLYPVTQLLRSLLTGCCSWRHSVSLDPVVPTTTLHSQSGSVTSYEPQICRPVRCILSMPSIEVRCCAYNPASSQNERSASNAAPSMREQINL
jgi:hypothetical protein